MRERTSMAEKEKEKFCDICGKSCNAVNKALRDPKSIVANEYATLSAEWGFCSRKDLIKHECIMCEECFDKVCIFIKDILGGNIKEKSYRPIGILRKYK